MSEFMKSVVEEVMKPYQKPKENPIFGGERSNQGTNTVTKTDFKNNQGINGINRPNYQRDKIQKRLDAISGEVHTKPANQHSKLETPPKKVPVSTITRDFLEGPLSNLQAISLSQGKLSINRHQNNTLPEKKQLSEESELIGHSKDGVKAWVFKGLPPNLGDSFQRSLKSNAIGVITADKCSVGQLFLINDLMREFSTIKYFLIWDKENKQEFVLELHSQDTESLTKVVKNLYQKLSQKSHKSTQVFKSLSPSSWLTKQLELEDSVNGVAVLEGIDYYTGILLLDRYMKKTGETNFGYLIKKTYLLLHGNYDIVTRVSEELQRDVQRYR